jgi:hypothetical protein
MRHCASAASADSDLTQGVNVKTIYGRCTADRLNAEISIETEVEDDATPDQIQRALWDAAVEAMDIGFWQTDEDGNALPTSP